MTPYPVPEPGPQELFKVAISSRAMVEMTKGLLKARFKCLRHHRLTPERACVIIVPFVALHIIAAITGEQHIAPQNENHKDNPIHPAAIPDARAVHKALSWNRLVVTPQRTPRAVKWKDLIHFTLYIFFFLIVQIMNMIFQGQSADL